ncbi:MAG: thiolase family protein [Oscillospiraceae bacterium]
MEKKREAVILACGRAPVGRGRKGSFRDTHPIEYAAQTLKGVLAKIPQVDPAEIEDVIVGCAMPYLQQGDNVARLICQRAEIPETTAAYTINRFCSSGLQAIGSCANAILAGQNELMVAGGVEAMSLLPMGSDPIYHDQWLEQNVPGAYMAMGLTAENVADLYGITTEEMNAFAVESHRKAALAQDNGWFDDQIIPIRIKNEAGEEVVVDKDEGIRRGTSMESLAELKPCFKPDGKVTAATSSQVSDSAAFVVLASREKAEQLGVKPIAVFRGFAVAGVASELMGTGPIAAVPKVMKKAGLTVADMDVIEINEAFAAQAIPCIRELKMPVEKVNPQGGAIALGHPLGATGCILTCKALSQLKRTGGRYALVTMCIGGGMGAAGIFELEP